MDLLDVLLDESNSEPIDLMDNDGHVITFDQVAIIPYGEDDERKLYVILKPVDKIAGVGDDEAIVFEVDENDDGVPYLRVTGDDEIAVKVFDKYYELLEKEKQKADGAGSPRKKNKK